MKKILSLLAAALLAANVHAQTATVTPAAGPAVPAAAITGIISPAKGGTGVANAATQTLTRSGAHALTITTSGTTSVTLPTSGTLAKTVSESFTTPNIGAATATSINFGGTTLSAYSEGSWTPVPAGLTVVGTPTYTGTYIKIGKLVWLNLRVQSDTSTASAANSTNWTGLPFVPARASVCATSNTSTANYGPSTFYLPGAALYTATWAAHPDVLVTCVYEAT